MKKTLLILSILAILIAFPSCGKTEIDEKLNSQSLLHSQNNSDNPKNQNNTQEESTSSNSTKLEDNELHNSAPSTDEQENNQTESDSLSVNDEIEDANLSPLLLEISKDFSDVLLMLTTKLDETFTAVGSTYADYKENKGLINNWIDLVLNETDSLFQRTNKNSIVYFKSIADDPAHEDFQFCYDSIDQYFEVVYDDEMDKYLDEIYGNAMDSLFDQYYNGIIDDAYNTIDYSEWSSASNDAYKTWSDASSAVYEKWSEETSYIYSLWSEVSSEFCWNNNFDVDKIVSELKEVENNKDTAINSEEKDTDTVESEESDITIENSEKNTDIASLQEEESSSGLRPEFKEAMDSYESFYDEYCEFMVKYKENSSDLKLLAEYSDMLKKYYEMETAFDAWESEDLSNEELAYYLDVNNRISKKLLALSE